MHFYRVAFKIAPSTACVENYENKISVINYFWLSPLGSDTQSYIKILQSKSTDNNEQNVIYKI